MFYLTRVSVWCLTLLLGFVGAWAQAQSGVEDFGSYRVHYSVFNSTQLTPEIASQYGLQRARDLALVNISVNRTDGEEPSSGQPAQISGTATNLMQQQQQLEFQEINEGRAHYYLAQVRHLNEEMYNFRILITPEGRDSPLELRFSQKLYTE